MHFSQYYVIWITNKIGNNDLKAAVEEQKPV